LLNNHHAFLFNYLSLYLDLFVGGQFSGCRRLATHTLNGVHHLGLLGEKGVAQLGGPFDVVEELLHDIGKRSQALNARVPVLLLDGFRQLLVFQLLVLRQPLVKLDDFERIGGCREHLGEQRIGIECDRRNQTVQLIR